MTHRFDLKYKYNFNSTTSFGSSLKMSIILTHLLLNIITLKALLQQFIAKREKNLSELSVVQLKTGPNSEKFKSPHKQFYRAIITIL